MTQNHVKSIAISNREILGDFFGQLFENSSAGYVLFGEKPLFLGSYCQPEWLIPGSDRHKTANLTFLALNSIENCKSISHNRNFVFVGSKTSNSLRYGMEFLIINKNAFFQSIHKSHSLFKYKFGYLIAPEELLFRLTKKDLKFSELFRNEIALQGILFGYGEDNSISYERASNVIELTNMNLPPFPPKKLPSLPKSEEEMIMRIDQTCGNSTSWKEIKEETKDFTFYHPKNQYDNLKIPFCFHKSSQESKDLIINYKNAQTSLNQSLQRKDFLEKILDRFGIHFDFIDQTPFYSPQATNDLSNFLGKSIYTSFSREVSTEFLSGMLECDKTNEEINLSEYNDVEFLDVLREQEFSDRTRRVKCSDTFSFFKQIASKQDVECLINDNLYYQTIDQGRPGKSTDMHTKTIEVLCTIRSFDDCLLYTCDKPIMLNSDELIPGLAYGMIGMQENEVREIYVHPDFAYGVDSKFGGGMPLKIQIKLIEIKSKSDQLSLPLLQPFGLEHITPKISSCSDYDRLQKKFKFYCGWRAWHHFKKIKPLVSLSEVVEALREPAESPSPQERIQIAILNYIIYQNLQ